MTELLTISEVDDALKNTKTKDKMKAILKRVVVNGEKPALVAADEGISRQAVHAAMKRLSDIISARTTPPGCRLVKVWLPIEQADAVEKRCRLMQMKENQEK